MRSSRLSQQDRATLDSAAALCRLLGTMLLAYHLEDAAKLEALSAQLSSSDCDRVAFELEGILRRDEGLAPLGELAIASRKA